MGKEEYIGEERRHQHWILKKEVHVGHIVTTAVVFITAIMWLTDVDKRVDLNGNDIEHIDTRFTHMNNTLIRVESKLDRLVERRSRNSGTIDRTIGG